MMKSMNDIVQRTLCGCRVIAGDEISEEDLLSELRELSTERS